MFNLITVIITTLAAWLGITPPSEVNALRNIDPQYLTTDTAQQHLAMTYLIGTYYRVSPFIMLRVAEHESNFDPTVSTHEPGNRWSCGVMTPEPHAEKCSEFEHSMLGGYVTGAAHFRFWLNYCNENVVCAARGYIGGGTLIRICATQEHDFIRPGVDVCDVYSIFLDRANEIRKAVIKVNQGKV